MGRARHRGLSVAQLRAFLALLFLALAVPTAVLIVQTARQMRWEAFHQYQGLADELATRIDAQLQRLITAEEARAYADYHFVVLAGDPNLSSFVQRSPLAQFPVASEVPGVLGYFEIDAAGRYSTPLLPEPGANTAQLGLDPDELAQRQALSANLFEILSRNQLVQRRASFDDAGERAEAETGPVLGKDKDDQSKLAALSKTAPPAAQRAFDELNAPANEQQRSKRNAYGRVEDLQIDRSYGQADVELNDSGEVAKKLSAASRAGRKEQSAIPESAQAVQSLDGSAAPTRVRIFESEVDPFEFGLLDSGHGVLFRRVWRDGRRTIQGLVIAQQPFLQGTIISPFNASALAPISDLVIAYDGDVLHASRGVGNERYDTASDLRGDLLHQARLSAPLGGFQLLWSVNELPAGAGARVVAWSSVVLFALLVLGFLAIYRLGLRQILLARQQQDFVSAVSHELRTPLTSIRMYAEMLREGWAGEDKKRGYYDFIHDESERLSRLIANVLQLARLERNELQLELKPVPVASLMELLRSKVHSQVERAGFACDYLLDPVCAAREVEVDSDAFVQIVINLVDNAIKFSAQAELRRIDIAVRARGAQAVAWSVRDYGPGVPKAQMRKIFQLFYRVGSELTRETVGTGIGLALVRQLAQAMHGEVDVSNREPGAEFMLTLPTVRARDAK